MCPDCGGMVGLIREVGGEVVSCEACARRAAAKEVLKDLDEAKQNIEIMRTFATELHEEEDELHPGVRSLIAAATQLLQLSKVQAGISLRRIPLSLGPSTPKMYIVPVDEDLRAPLDEDIEDRDLFEEPDPGFPDHLVGSGRIDSLPHDLDSDQPLPETLDRDEPDWMI